MKRRRVLRIDDTLRTPPPDPLPFRRGEGGTSVNLGVVHAGLHSYCGPRAPFNEQWKILDFQFSIVPWTAPRSPALRSPAPLRGVDAELVQLLTEGKAGDAHPTRGTSLIAVG